MTFLLGIFSSMLAGLATVKSKSVIENMRLCDFQKADSIVNVLVVLPVYFIINGVSFQNTKFSINIPTLLFLLLYLALRIVSNIAQNKLAMDKETDINLTTVILSTGCFLSLFLVGFRSNYILLIPIVLAVIGGIVAIVDFKSMRFKISKKAIGLLISAYIASGTKPFMANYLLDYYSISILVLLEYINYMVAYLVIFREGVVTKDNMLKVLPLALLSTVIMFCTYKVYSSVIVFVITSFTSTISTAVFSYILLKRKMSRQVCLGIAIITMAVISFKVLNM